MTATASVTSSQARPSSAPFQPWIAWSRLLAIVAVVSIHVFSHFALSWGDVAPRLWHAGNLVYAATRFCVPLFVLVSGAVLLGRTEPVRTFYARRAARIAIPLVVWTVFFLWFDAWTQGRPVTGYTFVQGFLWGTPYYHLYFLYVIAGLYLVTPFLRRFIAASSRRLVVAAAVVCIVLASADKLQHLLMGGGGFNAFSYFVPWLGYYLLGYVVATTTWRPPRLALASVFAACVLLTAAGSWWLFGLVGMQDGRVLYDYFSPQNVVATLALALLIRSLAASPGRFDRPLGWLAGLTFGVYLIHPIPLELVRRLGLSFADPNVDAAFHLGLVVALLVVCGLVVAGLRKIPLIRRLI